MADARASEAHIGIPWRPWDAEAFRLSRESDRPILLSIGATWCHWCHVMDNSTYRDPEVIRMVNAELVPVRVDTDRRPDINNRYNLGGWPTTAFLTPEGDLLSGGTYLPAEEFLSLLGEVLTYYHDRRQELQARLERRHTRRARISELRGRLRAPLGPEVVDNVLEAVRGAYDPQYGGFGREPKFPMPEAIELALALGQVRREPALTEIASSTLTGMAEGGIHDAEGGGFFRYATRGDWSAPHYEKLLETNARLLPVYLHAARTLDRPLYWSTARGIVRWAIATLRQDVDGAFAGSQDADEEYYHLPSATRAQRPAPTVDTTLYTNSNALMASALLEAAAYLDQPELARAARGALETLWRLCYEPQQGLAHYCDGDARLPGLLADQVWFAHALLDALAYEGRGDDLERARALFQVMETRLLAPEGSGFYDIAADPQALGRLRERFKLLDENAAAADLALRLHWLTGEKVYWERATHTLQAMAPLYRSYRQHAASYALAVYRFTHPPLHLIVVGDPEAEAARRLRLAALQHYDPNKIVESVDPVRDRDRLATLGLPATPAPVLYLRRGDVLSPPVQDAAQLSQALEGVPI